MYSKEFIEEVKAIFPDSKEIIDLAESGGRFLGRYLDDSSNGGFSIKKILEATSLLELQTEARSLQRKIDLYKWWGKEDDRIMKLNS